MSTALSAYLHLPSRIRAAIRGLDEKGLDLRGGSEGWSVRETVHHLVEANLIASNMIIAALANDGQEFDWTWVHPNKRWMQRVGYDVASVEPAIAMLGAIGRHLAQLLTNRPEALKRTVSLNDTPGAERYTRTIEEILEQEVEHAGGHLGDVQSIIARGGTAPPSAAPRRRTTRRTAKAAAPSRKATPRSRT